MCPNSPIETHKHLGRLKTQTIPASSIFPWKPTSVSVMVLVTNGWLLCPINVLDVRQAFSIDSISKKQLHVQSQIVWKVSLQRLSTLIWWQISPKPTFDWRRAGSYPSICRTCTHTCPDNHSVWQYALLSGQIYSSWSPFQIHMRQPHHRLLASALVTCG